MYVLLPRIRYEVDNHHQFPYININEDKKILNFLEDSGITLDTSVFVTVSFYVLYIGVTITLHYLLYFISSGILFWTPARRNDGRLEICYDDNFIVEFAHRKDAVIVSNDQYRDVIENHPEWAGTVRDR